MLIDFIVALKSSSAKCHIPLQVKQFAKTAHI